MECGMNGEQKKQVQDATRCLKLRDIQLYTSRFDRPTDVVAGEDVRARQEHLRGVRYVLGKTRIDETQTDILQIIVTLGTRVVADNEAAEPVYFVIEAEFLVEYEVTHALGEEAVKSFAHFNGVHNVWPFWRQHVFDIVQRARLPHLDIPLFAGADS
jgi:hypothetical protein